MNESICAIPNYESFWREYFPIYVDELLMNNIENSIAIGTDSSIMAKREIISKILFESKVFSKLLAGIKNFYSIEQKLQENDIKEMKWLSFLDIGVGIIIFFYKRDFILYWDKKNTKIENYINRNMNANENSIENSKLFPQILMNFKYLYNIDNKNGSIYFINKRDCIFGQNLDIFELGNKVHYYDFNSISWCYSIFKELEKFKIKTKKTQLYQIKIYFYYDYLALKPEYRNENSTSWSLFLSPKLS